MALALGLSLWTLGVDARARSSGAPFEGCFGCHNGTSDPPELSLELDPPLLEPGATVVATLTIRQGTMTRAGFYVTSDAGTLTPLTDESQALGSGLTHEAPLLVSNGQAHVSFEWQLPAEPGGSALVVYAVAANNDRRSQGDTPGEAVFPFAWGCELVLLYADLDGDGFGRDASYGISGGCGDREGWAARTGDCNDNSSAVFPGAEEVCNERDDDCDVEVDEGTLPRALYVDADGDGFGTGEVALMGCALPTGYAEQSGDCDDADPARYPGLAEICDLKDNDCNERVDEGARQRCGTGWCERLATSCTSDDCFPGEPRAEECNAFDDDCDGVVDNDATGCGEGLVCSVGTCLLPEDALPVESPVSTGRPGQAPTTEAPAPVTPTDTQPDTSSEASTPVPSPGVGGAPAVGNVEAGVTPAVGGSTPMPNGGADDVQANTGERAEPDRTVLDEPAASTPGRSQASCQFTPSGVSSWTLGFGALLFWARRRRVARVVTWS